MKKIFGLIILLLLFSACAEVKEITITFDANGGTEISSKKVFSNTIVSDIEYPIKQDNIFLGWFLDDETFLKPFSAHSLLDEKISSNITVYAKWTEIVDAPSGDVGLMILGASILPENSFYIIVLSNNIETYNFNAKATVNKKASFKIFSDRECLNEIESKEVSLVLGVNYFFCLVTAENEDSEIYNIQIDKIPTFTVTFENKENIVSTKQVKYGEALGELPVLVKEWYVFLGWSLEETGGSALLDADSVYYYNHNIMLFAQYEATPDMNAALIVFDQIALLNTEITLDDEVTITTLKQEYDALSFNQKELVNNFYILEDALIRIELLKDSDYFVLLEAIKTLGVHITKDTVMPTTVIWSYKDVSDQEFFDIETAKVKINVFSVKYITLIATSISDNSKTLEATINIGLIEEGENPLLYHDASTAVEEENWIGYTLTKTYTANGIEKTDVLFLINEVVIIKDKSGLVDASTLVTAGSNIWHSTGSVIVNAGPGDINFVISQTGDKVGTKTAAIAVIVNSDGSIDSMYDDPKTSVVLKAGQFIWIGRYIDGYDSFNMSKKIHFLSTSKMELKMLQERMFLNPAASPLRGTSADLSVNQDLLLKLTQSGLSCEVVYSSSDETVATVDAFGMVTAHAKGETVISATLTSDAEMKASFTVRVK